MQVSRLSLLVGFLMVVSFILFYFLSAPHFFLLLLLFSPFSVRCILLTCQVPSILVACLFPSVCLLSFCFSLAEINLAHSFFFSICAYINVQIIVRGEYAYLHTYLCVRVFLNRCLHINLYCGQQCIDQSLV